MLNNKNKHKIQLQIHEYKSVISVKIIVKNESITSDINKYNKNQKINLSKEHSSL